MIYFKDFIFCFGATAFFSVLFRAPKRTIVFTSLIASLGYLVYDLFRLNFSAELAGYFFGSLLVALLSEFAARVFKAPANIFLFPGIVPFVPGLGIYMTMRYMVEGDFNKFMQTGIYTLLIAGCIAASAAVSAIFYNNRSKKQNTEGKM